MAVIARIPDVSDRDSPAPLRPVDAPDGRLNRRVTRRPGGFVGLPDAWPTWPFGALVVIAVATWYLSTWRDQARHEPQRGEIRVAREPAPGRHTTAPAPVTGGAVFR